MKLPRARSVAPVSKTPVLPNLDAIWRAGFETGATERALTQLGQGPSYPARALRSQGFSTETSTTFYDNQLAAQKYRWATCWLEPALARFGLVGAVSQCQSVWEHLRLSNQLKQMRAFDLLRHPAATF
jgi:hypothetical protein